MLSRPREKHPHCGNKCPPPPSVGMSSKKYKYDLWEEFRYGHIYPISSAADVCIVRATGMSSKTRLGNHLPGLAAVGSERILGDRS